MTRKNRIVIVLMIITIGVMLAGCGKEDPAKKVIGEWQGNISFDQLVIGNAVNYLSTTSGMDIFDLMGDYDGSLSLMLSENGEYSVNLSEESYANVINKANDDFVNAFTEIAIAELEANGKTGSVESIQNALVTSIGMTLEDYFSEYGPVLLPSYDEIAAIYSENGHYEIDEAQITFTGDNGAVRVYQYVANEETLCLINEKQESIVYKVITKEADN